MKIGITCYPTFGGSGVLATELGKALAERNHEIHFIAYAPPQRYNHLSGNTFFHEVTVNTYPLFEYPPYSLALTSKMVDVALYEDLDILHVHYAVPHATSAVLARSILRGKGKNIPVVTTLHGTDITIVGQDASYSPVVTYSINESDGVTAVSEYLRRTTLDYFDIETEIGVIPNFVDTKRFSRLDRNHFREAICPDGEHVIVHVSNFRKVKRTQDVVHTFAGIRAAGVKAKLLLVGDGPERPATEVLCRELGVCSDIRFLGKQEPVEEILSIADLFLMPSESETFGLAALEAMSCEVPVVSSNIGGLPELNVHGETGFLCELGDIDDMVAKSLLILNDSELKVKMSKAARERAVVNFDIGSVVPIYEKTYEKAIAKMTALV